MTLYTHSPKAVIMQRAKMLNDEINATTVAMHRLIVMMGQARSASAPALDVQEQGQKPV